MAFQDFIASKISEKAAIETALARVISEIRAAESAAPAVDQVVGKIRDLMNILAASPDGVVIAAKEAIRESCGDISLLIEQPKEVVAITVPSFVSDKEYVSPVLEDIIGDDSNAGMDEKDGIVENTTIDSTTTIANEIVPITAIPTDKTEATTEENNKPKRRTQAGFDRKVKEWEKQLNNLDASNFNQTISEVQDEYRFWTDGTKFASESIENKIEYVIVYWSSLDNQEITTTAVEETVVENEVNNDLASFEVEEETKVTSTHKFDNLEQPFDPISETTEIQDSDTVDANEDTVESEVYDVEKENFLKQYQTVENLDQWNELKTAVTSFYGIDNIPQELSDINYQVWERLESVKDDLEDDIALEDEIYDAEDNLDDEELDDESEDSKLEIYDGDIPEDEELGANDGDLDDNNCLIVTERLSTKAIELIQKTNKTWQTAISECETLLELVDWDRTIAESIEKTPESILPETLTILEETRANLEAKETHIKKAQTLENLNSDWLNRAELAFSSSEIQTIYDEIRESGIVPSMQLINTLESAKARFEVLKKPTKVEPTEVEIQKAREDILPQETAVTVATEKKSPFARKAKVQVVVTEEASDSSTSEGNITLSSINTNGIYTFKTLDGKTETRNRYDEDYILPPDYKVYDPETGYVFNCITWEEFWLELARKNPLASKTKDTNTFPVRSMHVPTTQFVKLISDTRSLVVVTDNEAKELVDKYKQQVIDIENGKIGD